MNQSFNLSIFAKSRYWIAFLLISNTSVGYSYAITEYGYGSYISKGVCILT